MRFPRHGFLMSMILIGAFAGMAHAEVFLLVGGGRISGEWLNREENPRKKYVIQLESGGKVTLEVAQVEQVQRVRAEQAEYEKIRPDYPDTADAQWQLAEWCRQKKLPIQREVHLKRVIELDPDHVAARRALGYSKIDGKWARREDVMKERGYVFSKGQWKLPQEIERDAEKAKNEAAQVDWAQKISRWRKWLGTNRDAEARANLLGLTDPMAVAALVRGLRDDNSSNVRLLYAEVLAKIDSAESNRALAIAAIEDRVEEVRLTCLDYLQKTKRPEAVAYFVGKLRAKDNVTVNLAGVALGRMKDPSSVPALIDALATEHRFKIPKAGGEGSITPTFSSGPNGSPGGGGLAMGGGPQFVTRTIANQAVLDALVAVTGQNFSWDKAAWRAWLASQKQVENIDARRN